MDSYGSNSLGHIFSRQGITLFVVLLLFYLTNTFNNTKVS